MMSAKSFNSLINSIDRQLLLLRSAKSIWRRSAHTAAIRFDLLFLKGGWLFQKFLCVKRSTLGNLLRLLTFFTQRENDIIVKREHFRTFTLDSNKLMRAFTTNFLRYTPPRLFTWISSASTIISPSPWRFVLILVRVLLIIDSLSFIPWQKLNCGLKAIVVDGRSDTTRSRK